MAAYDPFDSVGVMDSFFPSSDFFTEFERFDRHIEKLKRSGDPIDYVTICSPNYLHDAHIRFGLRHGADVICEKPIVLNPWKIEALKEIEKETGRRIHNILQLRLHPSVIALKEKVQNSKSTEKYDFDLTYITSRGKWYYTSWKGEEQKSGGIATNIGVHFFDMLIWIFGKVQDNIVHIHTHDRAAGYLELERARVRWFLSINKDMLPDDAIKEGKPTFRSLTINGEQFEFSDGFTNLHTESYRAILEGQGFGLEETIPSINLVHDIRNIVPVGLKGEYHPLAAQPISKHPFAIKTRSEHLKFSKFS